jgi:hypothetical protein
MSSNSSLQSVGSDSLHGLEPKSCDPFWACCLSDYEDVEVNKKKSRLSIWRKDYKEQRDVKKRKEEQRKREKRKAKEDAEAQAKYPSLRFF